MDGKQRSPVSDKKRLRGRQRNGTNLRLHHPSLSPTPLFFITTSNARFPQPSGNENRMLTNKRSDDKQICTNCIEEEGNDGRSIATRSQLPTQNTHSKRSSKKSILLILSENCSRHRKSGVNHHKICPYLTEKWSDVPKYCQEALGTLKRIIPKVEETIRVESIRRQSTENKNIVDLGYMCDFYNDIIAGGFCPNALHLFDVGKSAIHILLRVFYLYQHLASEHVIHNTTEFLCSSTESTTSAKNPLRSCIWLHLCQTIVNLMDCVTDSHVQYLFVCDLIDLAIDLAVLAESALFKSGEKLEKSVKVIILDETRKQSIKNSKGMTPGAKTDSFPDELSLFITNTETLLSLQAATYLVMNEFLRKRKDRRLVRQDVQYDLDKSRQSLCPDIYFSGVVSKDHHLNTGQDGGDDSFEKVFTLLASIRQVLQSSTCRVSPAKIDPDHETWVTRMRALTTLARNNATKTLYYIQHDLSRSGTASIVHLHDVSRLVCCASVVRLEEERQQCTNPILVHLIAHEMNECLADLVHGLVSGLATVSYRWSNSFEGTKSIYVTTFTLLLDALGKMDSKNLSTVAASEVIRLQITAESAMRLRTVIVRTIHFIMSKILDAGINFENSQVIHSISCGAQLTSSISPLNSVVLMSLFDFLVIPALADHALQILSHVMTGLPFKGQIDRVLDIDHACHLCLIQLDRSVCPNGSEDVVVDDLAIDVMVESGISSLRNCKRKAIGSSVNVKKIRKFANDTLCIFMDCLIKFLSLAYTTSRTMRESHLKMNGIEFVENQNLCNVFPIQTIASAAVLLFAHCDPGESNPHPNQFQNVREVLNELLQSVLWLSDKLVSNITEKNLMRQQTLIGSCSSCGIHISSIINKRHPQVLSMFSVVDNELLSSVLIKSKEILVSVLHLTAVGDQLPNLPKAFTEIVMATIIPQITLTPVGIQASTHTCLFEDIVLSIEFNAENSSCLPAIYWVSPFLQPADEFCDRTQSIQLQILEGCRNVHQSGHFSQSSDLSEMTIRNIGLGVNMRSTTSFERLLIFKSIQWLMHHSSPENLRSFIALHESINQGKAAGGSFGSQLVEFVVARGCLDPDPIVRSYASRESASMLAAHKWSGILACLASDAEWHHLKGSDINAQRKNMELVTFRFFERIDDLLLQNSIIPESHESCTSSPIYNTKRDTGMAASGDIVISYRHSTVRFLLAFCQVASRQSHNSKIACEHALLRVVRLWYEFDTENSRGSGGLCFAEMSRIAHGSSIRFTLRENFLSTFAPALFYDLLIPTLAGASNESLDTMISMNGDRHFQLLTVLIQLFLTESNFFESNILDVERSLNSCLAFVISHFVIEKDYDILRLATAYKVHVMTRKRSEGRCNKATSLKCAVESSLILEEMNEQSNAAVVGSHLEDKTRELCLAPNVIESIIPLIFGQAGPSELIFFTKIVLQAKITLNTMITSREQLILKSLVLELGRDPQADSGPVRALSTAAVARIPDVDHACKDRHEMDLIGQGLTKPSDQCAVKDWVTSHFMYLLVNVVQYRWSTKNLSEKVVSMRCLSRVLNFLHANEAPQYVPQIIATVGVAIGEEAASEHTECEQLRMLAVTVFATFLKLVAQHSWETLGQHLTSIVVSLMPLLIDDDDDCITSGNQQLRQEYRKGAADLLEWMTSGSLGKNLSRFFAEIPFLPQSAQLTSFYASLRALGVDLSNPCLSYSQRTQHDVASKSSHTSEGSTSNSDIHFASVNMQRQAALRKRLETIYPLLGNDNVSIRKAVLKHLIALLRSNRASFSSLVENDDSASMKRYLTIAYPGTSGVSRGAVTEVIQALLSRCVHEDDIDVRLLLATCFGEVGAISEHRLEELRPVDCITGESVFQVTKPPWRSRPERYELLLVTTHLVAALKAATSASDQHKIAFTIQQVLSLLDKSVNEGVSSSGNHRDTIQFRHENTSIDGITKSRMSNWLSSKLKEANVLEVVEPFWFSEFHEAEIVSVKQPPFFQASTSFYGWLSNLCRYLVHRSQSTKQNKWSELFYACRTALRTQAGICIAEFLLPILVLDSLCFGKDADRQILLRDIIDTLTFDENEKFYSERMNKTDRQKAVSAVFNVIDQLQFWSETETEKRHIIGRRPVVDVSDGRKPLDINGDEWPLEESVLRIEDLLKEISLEFRAKAASKVGMHAYALRLIEMAARSAVAHVVFDSSSSVNTPKTKSRAAGYCPENQLSFMKDVLASLNDYETMVALGQDDFWSNPSERVLDSIRQHEALEDWEAALQDYERAQQLNGNNPHLQLGTMRCLLNLGHFESTLQQVTGIISSKHSRCHPHETGPIAVEAAWRLGRWETLAELVDNQSGAHHDSFEFCLGEVMVYAHKKRPKELKASIDHAKCILIDGLSSVSRESYARAYKHIVRLQALREIEDVAEAVCSENPVCLGNLVYDSYFSWDLRLDILALGGATTVLNTRLALGRLADDHSFQGDLFLNMGKRARKRGLYGIASNAFAQSEAAIAKLSAEGKDFLTNSLRLQVAKLKHDCGESNTALRLLGQERIELMDVLKEAKGMHATTSAGRTYSIYQPHTSESDVQEMLVKSALQSTRWMIEGGLQGGFEIMNRFKIIHNAAPNWEKGHFQYGKYIDSVLRSRILALEKRSAERYGGADEDILRSRVISNDKACQKYVLLAMTHFARALSLDIRHVYQALPRLLSLWFELTCIKENVQDPEGIDLRSHVEKVAWSDLPNNQEEANTLMAKSCKEIPAQAFYTAMPQLISRITHADEETALVVRGILKRVLTKFPEQAMWPLAWVTRSRDSERRNIGNNIFHEAERTLAKDNKTRHQYNLLAASGSLFTFLHDLAKYDSKKKTNTSNTINVKPWKGDVDLLEFIPPIQAALSVSCVTTRSTSSVDAFPRHVPRMRTFASEIQVMSSKARPKKIRVFVVSTDSTLYQRRGIKNRTENSCSDIGEIHFLVKQEARGDLRKDARVQDLNNVINRLMSSSNDSKGDGRQRRRLHLRTFAVTCLSEETGIVEWVPDTDSLRNLVSKAYNPQAKPFSSRRRGKRYSFFADPSLKENFETKCQPMYFKSGNLTRAAALFEELCLKPYPPLLYWWFVQKFHDPHTWYEARNRFTLSASVWSAVGHIIGLGDRHSENILVDTISADCVHVDFDCIFDKGLHLPKPEVIPFRLTQNMIDAFGPTGADGIFTENMKVAMSTLRRNRDTLLSVLEPFTKDPIIDWKGHRSQQTSSESKAITAQDLKSKEMKRSINVIDERLRGIYNLKNPNKKKIRRTDVVVDQQDDEHSHLLPLSVEGQVHKLIAEATSNENLVQLYIGWMPWI